MLLQGGRNRVKRSGEREVFYNVHKFMNAESEMGVTIPLSKVRKKVAESTRVSRTSCRMLKEGENAEKGVVIAF